MCGIAGYISKSHVDPAVLRAMCDAIRHRGPDDAGYLTNGEAGIGMRRLSIIDLNTGHQPISNEDGSVWTVFNGEIYNYLELRPWLERRGHRFKTRSDTETIVHLYEEEGASGVSRLRGMFALAIWDARAQKLVLARDRLGKKPLYYAHIDGGFFFASELKSLRAAGLAGELDRRALQLFLQFTWIPDPWTIFRDAHKLPPGCWLEIDSSGECRMERYWSFPPPRQTSLPNSAKPEMRERIRAKIDESVRLRMIADVPLGAFLSGGIDSSIVVSSMALQSSRPVTTFSIGFEEAAYNELGYARLVAEKYQTDHHEIIVRPNAIDLVEKLVRQFDEPFADSSAIPTFIVSEFARRHVKVALSGDGGDELFAGYDIFQRAGQLERFGWMPGPVRSGASYVADVLPYQARGKNYLHMLTRHTARERYLESNYAPYQMRKRMLDPQWLLGFEDLPREWFGNSGGDLLSEMLYFEAVCKLPGDMLVKVDRMSMLASLEVRCPLLDHELAELSAEVPNAWKIRGGRGKAILVDAMADRLPPELLRRPKSGFAVPLSPWLRGPLREMLRDHLTGSSFEGRQIARPAAVRELIEEHESGRRDNHTWLWSLLVLEMWFRQVETAEPAAVSCR